MDEQYKRYRSEARRVQSGVAHKMNINPADTEPKHLRVGVNVAHVDIASISRLLMAKGVFTELELATALADGMQRERESYERELSKHFRAVITLGEAGLGE